MAMTNYPFPYDIENLLGGAVRILRAPQSQAEPDGIHEVIDLVAPYAPKTGWLDVGATKEAFSYSRGFAEAGYEIQNTQGAVLTEITDVTRTITVSYAEFTQQSLAVIEGDTSLGTVAAAAGVSAQKIVRFGGITSTDEYRFAFISRRHIASGAVVEPGGAKRGRFVMGLALRASLAADDVSIEQAKGNLSAAGVTFRMFPDPAKTVSEESWGGWFLEDAGTIA